MQHVARYACHPDQSRGRFHAEQESPGRSPFQRDRDRIIHSTAFRRLEYKTQVFVNHEGDHYRTRLTHSLEVSQLARGVARSLQLNEDLAEALALAHDLGHPPFGHAGEQGLDEVMQPYGGFDHNAQTIRIVTKLEQRYASFDGLNLTWETLEGIAKHNGPLVRDEGRGMRHEGSENLHASSLLPRALVEYNSQHDLELHTYASLEAQVASLADDIAYNNHDIDDGIRAGLFSVEDLKEIAGVGAVFAAVETLYPGTAQPRLVHEAIRRLIHGMVTDLAATTRANIAAHQVKSVDEVRHLGVPLAAFSDAMQAQQKALKEFLWARMYRHYKVNRMSSKAQRVVRELFKFFMDEPECLPTDWRSRTEAGNPSKTAEVVADYIGGMTDRYALEVHSRVLNVESQT